MRPADLDKLRDKMCVELLEATSSDTALQRYRLEVKMGYPAYDEVDRRYAGLQPRDEVRRCMRCGEAFVHRGIANAKRFCSTRCRKQVEYAQRRAGLAVEVA